MKQPHIVVNYKKRSERPLKFDPNADKATQREIALATLAKMKEIERQRQHEMVEWKANRRTVIKASSKRMAEIQSELTARSKDYVLI